MCSILGGTARLHVVAVPLQTQHPAGGGGVPDHAGVLDAAAHQGRPIRPPCHILHIVRVRPAAQELVQSLQYNQRSSDLKSSHF